MKRNWDQEDLISHFSLSEAEMQWLGGRNAVNQNGSSVDNGASSSNGGLAFLHILQAAASDTYSIVVEGSSDNSVWGTVDSFTLDASAIGSERLILSGTLPRYLRFKATRSGSAGDTVRLAMSVIRF